MKPFGYFYGNKGRRKFVLFFNCEFTRNLYAMADRDNGFRVRCFNLRPSVPTYYGA